MSYNKETGMYEGYIYKIVNDINGKIYIGQTRRDVDTRFKEHCKGANITNKKKIQIIIKSSWERSNLYAHRKYEFIWCVYWSIK